MVRAEQTAVDEDRSVDLPREHQPPHRAEAVEGNGVLVPVDAVAPTTESEIVELHHRQRRGFDLKNVLGGVGLRDLREPVLVAGDDQGLGDHERVVDGDGAGNVDALRKPPPPWSSGMPRSAAETHGLTEGSRSARRATRSALRAAVVLARAVSASDLAVLAVLIASSISW